MIEAINSNKKQSAILGFSSTLLTQVIAIGLAFLFSVIFTRILGPAGRGVYSVFTSSAMILVQLSALGFPTANAYYCSKDEENLPALFGNSLILTAVFTIFFLALLFVWPDLQKYLSIDPAYFQIGLWFFAISIPLNFLSQLMRDLLLGKRWFIQYNLAKISTVVSFGVLGLILILFLSNKILAVLLGNALSALVPILVALWFLLPIARWSFSPSMLRNSALLGWRVYVFTLTGLVLARLNIFMVNQWLGNEQVGLYSAAQTLAELSTNLPIAAAPVIFTLTAKDHFSGIQLVLKTNRLISFLILVGNLVVAVLCIPLLYIYGPKFPEAKYALWLMLPGMQAYSVVLVLRSHFQGLGFPLPTLVIPFVGLVVNSSLNLWLLPMIGISGASLSLTFGYIAMTLLSVWYLKIRNPGITLSELFMITPSEVSDYLAYLRRNSRRLLLHVEK